MKNLSDASKWRDSHNAVRSLFKSLTSRLLWGLLSYSAGVTAVHSADGGTGSGPSAFVVVLFIVVLITISVLLIVGITRWGHKQDNIGKMMPFCIKYLAETSNEPEKCEAARALGHVKDPGALLILTDVINDENAEENLRRTAADALSNLARIYHPYKSVIKNLLDAVEEKDHKKSIEILIANFEHREHTYVQSAYVIGREYMRLKEYAEARTWLQEARNRNARTVVYVNQISELIDACNVKLFSEGDVLFKVGDYYDALERYALASHDLGYEDKKRFASHLRLACVYCRLGHYEDAYQETLHALHDHHEVDLTLKLNDLLKVQRGEIGGTPDAEERRKTIAKETDEYVAHIMDTLVSR